MSAFKDHPTLTKIFEIGIVPVVKLDSPDAAVPLARALTAGDMPIAEVTFRTDAAEESIKNISREMPDMLVGAGTVLTVEQADRAVAAGAKFIVSPGFNPKVVAHCIARGVPITPGVSSPSQVEQGLELGLGVLKFFPAEQAGGIPMLKALAGPYGHVKFVPTGGIGVKNMRDYLALGNVAAIGGSWMVAPELVKAGEFDKIAALCREAVGAMLNFQLSHLGVNEPDADAARDDAARMASIFGFDAKEGAGSFFVGNKNFEIMKGSPFGAHGHIAMGTDSVERAVAYLARRGVDTKAGTEGFNPDGSMRNIYLDIDIAGFAVHLLKNEKK